MAADHGMLFLFESAYVQTFWMKNTRIPLDILYFDSNYKLVSVQERVPPCRSDPARNTRPPARRSTFSSSIPA